MTACLPLQDCIVQTTSLPAYGRNFCRCARWSPDNKATGLRPDNSATSLHAYSHRYMGAAVAGYQTACMRMTLPCCSSRFSNCSHCNAVAGYQTASAKMRTAVLLQWQDTKLHAQWQFHKLLNWVMDEQTCNSNNKAICILLSYIQQKWCSSNFFADKGSCLKS
jgi:hypothetical protein